MSNKQEDKQGIAEKRRNTRRIAIEMILRFDARELSKDLLEEIGIIDDYCDLDYLKRLFEGITNSLPELDLLIQQFVKGWRLERLDRTDLAIMRVAVYEIKFLHDEVPPITVINEAVELAKEFGSTAKTPGFVNAILDSIKKHLLVEQE
jgi:N utilization substance protein B